MARPGGSPALTAFLSQWLGVNDVASVQKETAIFKQFTPKLAADLQEESRLLASEILTQKRGSVPELLQTRAAFVTATTAPIYGLKATGTTPARVELDPGTRRGVLTQAAFLAAVSSGDHTNASHRGSYLREELLCQDVPPLPEGVDMTPVPNAATLTERERLAAHRQRGSACAGCHQLFDDLGLALENYDALGVYRTTDKGKPIDASGTLALPDGSTAPFSNALEMIDALAKAPSFQACVANQALAYASGRHRNDITGCERSEIWEDYAQSGYELNSLVVALVRSPGFALRRN